MSGKATRVVRRLACGLASLGITAAASACSAPAPPLAADVAQGSQVMCVPAPRPHSATTSWNSPIWFALDMFVNEARSPLTIESVSLIDPHNVVLRGAMVYTMPHSQHPLMMAGSTRDIAVTVPAADWKRRQAVPGAVIASGHPVVNYRPRYSLTIYEIVPELSLKTRHDGWAIGETVTYRADGQTYTVSSYSGYGIVTRTADCSAQLKVVLAAFAANLG